MHAQILDKDDTYYFNHPALDQSQLKAFLHNPANWAYSRLHPENNKPTDAMRFGTAFHAYIMNTQNVVSLPEGETFRSTANKAWREEREAEGDLVVSWEQLETLERMKTNIERNNPEMMDIIRNGTCEQMIVWEHAATGLQLKAKPDIIPTGTDYLIDIKTAQSAGVNEFRKESIKYGYPIQALFYIQAVGMCAPHAFQRASRVPKSMQFWVFEKSDACEWAPYSIRIDNPVMETAKQAIKKALWGIRELIDKAKQAGYGDTVDSAAQYLLEERIPRSVEELEYTDWDLTNFDRDVNRQLADLETI